MVENSGIMEIKLDDEIATRHTQFKPSHHNYGSIMLTVTKFCEDDTWYYLQKGKIKENNQFNEEVVIVRRLTRKV